MLTTLLLKNILLGFLLVTSICGHAAINNDAPYQKVEHCITRLQPFEFKKQEPDWPSFINRYITTLTAGASVGISSGALCALMQKYLFNNSWTGMGISWIFVYGVRNMLINALQKDMNSARIPHNKAVMAQVARLTDWLTYLAIIYT